METEGWIEIDYWMETEGWIETDGWMETEGSWIETEG
jgi:hypothetical protein